MRIDNLLFHIAMSANIMERDVMSRCANCGVGEGDGIELKTCTACKSVKYCGITCQKKHRPKHKRACKKRAAEIRDEILFKQPESRHLGDCPICFLPHSLDEGKTVLMICCGKLICNGCNFANQRRELEEGRDHKCPFCRQLKPESGAEAFKILMDRAAEMKCTISMCEVGLRLYKKGEFQAAFDYYSRAAALGNLEGHCMLAEMYFKGEGVEKDVSKAVHHTELAAMGGHASARNNLGGFENENRRCQRAIKHWMIGAKAGHDHSLENLKKAYKKGFLSKDDFAEALRGHQAALNATKSPQREEAAEERRRIEEYMRQQNAYLSNI